MIAAGFSSLFPNILNASDADSYGAIVVSGIILVSLAPLLKGLYLTACKLHHMQFGDNGERRYSKELSLEVNV